MVKVIQCLAFEHGHSYPQCVCGLKGKIVHIENFPEGFFSRTLKPTEEKTTWKIGPLFNAPEYIGRAYNVISAEEIIIIKKS